MEADLKKFYTPNISEFHVGFECELHSITVGGLVFFDAVTEEIEKVSEPSIPVWEKYIFRKDDVLTPIGLELNRLQEMLSNEQVRVKHLDREDIESLGFENYEYQPNVKGHYWNKGNNELLFRDNGVILICTINEGWEDWKFQGTIKNKSELKRILKMIGI